MPRLIISLVTVLILMVTSPWFSLQTAALSSFQERNSEHKTVWSGVYAESQADKGQAIFGANCSQCHGIELGGGPEEGAPPLRGDKFMESWREDNLESLFNKIINTMPRDLNAPGATSKNLTEQETLYLVSYILHANNF